MERNVIIKEASGQFFTSPNETSENVSVFKQGKDFIAIHIPASIHWKNFPRKVLEEFYKSTEYLQNITMKSPTGQFYTGVRVTRNNSYCQKEYLGRFCLSKKGQNHPKLDFCRSSMEAYEHKIDDFLTKLCPVWSSYFKSSQMQSGLSNSFRTFHRACTTLGHTSEPHMNPDVGPSWLTWHSQDQGIEASNELLADFCFPEHQLTVGIRHGDVLLFNSRVVHQTISCHNPQTYGVAFFNKMCNFKAGLKAKQHYQLIGLKPDKHSFGVKFDQTTKEWFTMPKPRF